MGLGVTTTHTKFYQLMNKKKKKAKAVAKVKNYQVTSKKYSQIENILFF